MAGDPVVQTAPVLSDYARLRAFWRDVEEGKINAALGTLDGPKARARLLALLRAQETDLARTAKGSALTDYREAQYVMAATADDAFVRLEWRGAEEWMMNPLETDLFGSRCAGQLVFDRIDQLMIGTHPTARARAEIYVTALALGFEGKYAGSPEGHEALAEYRRKLHAFLSSDRGATGGPLVPQCYASTAAVGTGRLLRGSRLWWWTSAAIVGIWLIVSSLLWLDVRSAATAGQGQAAPSTTGAGR